MMLDILSRVAQVKDSPISILIEGDTGTGKDFLAKAIHFNSNRKGKRFISVNCAALPETLLESELFGYKRGAFTGADGEKVGLFEEADGGTFFLDEIGD
ncbi:MAG: sigma 54-interacting transcriptional regulator, partial [candidate division Zixibacteria bacterium]|nr:sigma 54-interacting transcriptional regulator [candidate division Zixibacteria bacterium]